MVSLLSIIFQEFRKVFFDYLCSTWNTYEVCVCERYVACCGVHVEPRLFLSYHKCCILVSKYICWPVQVNTLFFNRC